MGDSLTLLAEMRGLVKQRTNPSANYSTDWDAFLGACVAEAGALV